LFGVDLVRFNEAGKMADLVGMLRPASVLTKLGEEAALRMAAAKLPFESNREMSMWPNSNRRNDRNRRRQAGRISKAPERSRTALQGDRV
jgi:hypothetical protein